MAPDEPGEADAARRPARIGVEHRDDDRHVGAADRQDEEETERQRDDDQQHEGDGGFGGDEPGKDGDQRDTERGIEEMLPGEDERLARDQALQLGEGDDRAGEGDGADRGAETHLGEAAARDGAGRADTVGLRRREGGRGDADRGKADEAVERGDELRQRRHLDLERDVGADGAADQDAEDDDRKAAEDDVRRRQRGGDRDHHAGDAVEVAGARRHRRAQAAQRHDEADRGDEIEEGREVFAHCCVLTLPFSS